MDQQNPQSTPSPSPAPPNPQADSPSQTRKPFNVASIYPDLKSHKPSGVPPSVAKSETPKLSFAKGYAIGSSVFWLQLLAGFLLGIFLKAIILAAISSGSVFTVLIVGLVVYGITLAAGIYVPFYVLRTSNIEAPLWLALMGSSIEGFLFALISLIIFIVEFSVLFSQSSVSLLSRVMNHLSGKGVTTIAAIGLIAVIIGAFMAVYYGTKLAYGLAFAFVAKINNPQKTRTIAIALFVLLLVSGVAVHSVDSYWAKRQENHAAAFDRSEHTPITSTKPAVDLHPAPAVYTQQTVKAHDFTVTLDFDPHLDSSVSYQAAHGIFAVNDVLYISGYQLNTKNNIVVAIIKLGAKSNLYSINPAQCKSASDISTSSQGDKLLFNSTIDGQVTAVCGYSTASDNSADTGADAFFAGTDGNWYAMQFGTSRGGANDAYGSSPISTVSMQTIADSIQVK